MKYDQSSLDMGPTIRFYDQNKGILSIPKNGPLNYPVENPGLIGLTNEELSGLVSLLPKNALERSILKKIVGCPLTYFHKDSTNANPIPTNCVDEAISETAIAPSRIDVGEWIETKIPQCNILIYDMPGFIKPETKKVILAEAFVHELGHTLIHPILYTKNSDLELEDGRRVDGLEFILDFAKKSEAHLPISAYSAFYRDENNLFKGETLEKVKVSISEELAESIAAYLVGFSYSGDERSLNPFKDRPEIKQFVSDFLKAKKV